MATRKKTTTSFKKQLTSFKNRFNGKAIVSAAMLAALIVGFATYALVQSARAGTSTVTAEIDGGTISTPAKGVKGISSASGGGVIAFAKKGAVAKPATETPSDSDEDEDKEKESTSSSSKASSGSAAGCTIDKSAKLKDQDNEDTQHPWKVKTKGQKVVINFTTKGITGKNLEYMKAGEAVWDKSPCIDVRLVPSCPSGENCVEVKFNDGGGADGNYSESVSGGYQTGKGVMEVKKDLSDNERKNVTIHEMGHAVGLKHVKTEHVMMNTETYDDVFEASENDYHNLKVLYANQK